MKLRTKAMMFAMSAAIFTLPQPALAWDATGHMTVANVAQLNLNPAVLTELRGLLALESQIHLSKIASWADTQRDAGDPIHTTRIPINGSTAPAHACPGTTALCADEAITHYGAILANRSNTAAVRLEALKYIVHLVGDLHQPLHGSDPIGYNYVSSGGTVKMIHAVWDIDIIAVHGVASAALAQELLNNGISVTTGGTPRDWAAESSDMARDHIYDTLPACWSGCPTTPPVLPANYNTVKYPLVAQRLKQAGLRLADLLNDLLTP